MSEKGGAVRIELANGQVKSNITFLNNLFIANAALYGGSVYCKYCNITSFTLSSFRYGQALNGTLLYLDSPTSSSLTIDTIFSDFSSNFLTPEFGSPIYINDTLHSGPSSTFSLYFVQKQTTLFHKFLNNQGPFASFVYLESQASVAFYLDALTFDTVKALDSS